MTIRLLWRDTRITFRSLIPYLVAALFLGATLSLRTLGKISASDAAVTSRTLGDFIAYAFNFAAPINFQDILNGRPLSITFPWLLAFAALFAMTLDYPRHDLRGPGYHTLVATGNRWPWWIAKCLWVCLVIAAFWTCFLLGVAVPAIYCGADPSLLLTQDGVQLLTTQLSPYQIEMTIVPLLLLTIPICSSFGLIQLLISIHIDRIAAYTFCLSVVFASALFSHPLLLGNFLISGRSVGAFFGGFPLNEGLALSIGISSAVVLVGGALFSRKTIFGGASHE